MLLLDKAPGLTSNAALQAARRLYRAAKAGHTGTLDPLATGLLPVLFGEATKFGGELLDADKTYAAVIALGATTTTGDAEGEVVERQPVAVTRNDAERVLAGFRGPGMQVPPMYSALKRDGRPLYEYARAGQSIDRPARPIRIDALVLDALDGTRLAVTVRASKGTYVRVLAEDIGRALGCGAHLAALRRTRSGPFRIEQAKTVAECARAALSNELEGALIPPAAALGFPVLAVVGEQRRRLQNGGDLAAGELHREPPGTRVSIVDEAGEMLAVTELGVDRRLWPLRVLAPEPV